MKKSLLLFAVVYCSTNLFGQVAYQKLSLNEAIEESKATNKMVMIMASNTW